MVELTPELIKDLSKTRNGFYSWDYVAGLAVWILGVEANNERLLHRIAELEIQLKSKDIIINNQQGRLNYYATKDLLGGKNERNTR